MEGQGWLPLPQCCAASGRQLRLSSGAFQEGIEKPVADFLSPETQARTMVAFGEPSSRVQASGRQ